METRRYTLIYVSLVAAVVLLLCLSLMVGAVSIPAAEVFDLLTGGEGGGRVHRFIVLGSRLPQALTAMLCGAGLAAAGLLLQTAFRNALAGPGVFGIGSGAALGVAIVMLAGGGTLSAGTFSIGGLAAVMVAAFAGAMTVTLLLLFMASVLRSGVMLLITGLMTGYVASSVISLLQFFATEQGVQSYMVWGMGSFAAVSMELLPAFAALTVAGLGMALLMVKPLNAMLLGELYAESMGFSTGRIRAWLLLVTGLLTATCTAFCGPIGFIGLAVPHIARMLTRTDEHSRLLPATMLTGSVVALLCNIVCVLPLGHGLLPLGAVTPLMGAPVIIYVILRERRS
ncbi:MAG: iron ABC transporter permease [Prevotella sp.]|nr:iron ABC transporter permease [Prevotella sp.]